MTSHSKKTKPSESGHWYDQHGNQIGEVERSDGKGTRKPTLRDARKNNWGPGVTTITQCASAPALTNWKMRQTAYAAADVIPMPELATSDWVNAVVEAANKIAKDAAEEGTRIHKAIEQFYSDEPYDQFYEPHVLGVANLIDENCASDVAMNPWLAEKGVAHHWGYGTKADLHSEAWVLDFKGSDKDLSSIKTYDSHWMQLAATAIALEPDGRAGCGDLMPKQRCAIVYVSRTNPGECAFVEVTDAQLKKGLAMFKALLRFWQARSAHTPDWETINDNGEEIRRCYQD